MTPGLQQQDKSVYDSEKSKRNWKGQDSEQANKQAKENIYEKKKKKENKTSDGQVRRGN